MTFLESLKANKFYLLGLLPLLGVLYSGIFPDMVLDWYNDENYSHGFLVPFISAFFIYQRWDDLRTTPAEPSNLGLLVIAGGLGLLSLGYVGTEYFSMRVSLVILLAGLVLYFFGIKVFKKLSLPLGFLVLMVPIPYIVYDAAAFPLKLFVTEFSVATLKLLGVIVWHEGNIIMFPNTVLEVADACSGLRSIMSLLALGVAFAFLTQKSMVKRWLIIFSTLPIAVLTNAMRVIVTGFLAQYWGAQVAEGFFHDFAGFAVFFVAMVLLLAFGGFLSLFGRKNTTPPM
ncbi:exosortase A [Desulfonatronum thioautotrophicum]|uniref:exosortase A n=1 Tax=Desulfonatronum thioautotrophicum TaxID=617001 RepID=UPI0005EAD250|nr:exosortase A [Desulfonatronum thioautotrophicum]